MMIFYSSRWDTAHDLNLFMGNHSTGFFLGRDREKLLRILVHTFGENVLYDGFLWIRG